MLVLSRVGNRSGVGKGGPAAGSQGCAGAEGLCVRRGHAPQDLLVWKKAGAFCSVPSSLVQFLLTPAGRRPSPEEHLYSCTGRRHCSRRRCLIPSAEQGSLARIGKGRQGGGPGAPGTRVGSTWPDVAGWPEGERSRALGTVCPPLLRKH